MPAKPLPRLPLCGLAVFAVAGIWIADRLSPDPRVLVVAACAGLLLAPWRRGLVPLWLAAACIFGAAHVWQWQENPSRRWADALAAEPQTIRVTGVLTDEPAPAGGAGGGNVWRCRMRAEKWTTGNGTVEFAGEILVRWKTDETPRYGDRWRIEGIARKPQGPSNPGEFDAAGWLARQGVFLEVRGRDGDHAVLLARGAGSRIKAAALATRAWMLHTLGLGVEDAPAIRALVAGITLGVREAEADQFADAFRQTGTFHLFSVSGLHVGMFALLLWLALRPLGFTRRKAVLVIVPLLFFYSLVTGASPPSLRSAVMISVAFGGFLLDRPNTPANSLAAAALMLLAWDTNQLFSPGFQLSFFIVAAIFLLAPGLQDFFARRLRPDPFLPRKLYTRAQKLAADGGHALASTLGVSAAAWLGSLPLTAAVFHLVPVLAVPANLLAVPLAFAILAVSMLSILAGPASAWLAAVFNNANWGLASLLLATVQGTASLPGSYVYMPPGWMQPPARLTVFDLGTGGAQLLRTRQSAWLFDTGDERDFTRILEPAMRTAGVGRLDALVITHGDAGHTGGGVLCLAQARPRSVIDSALRDRSPARKSLHAALRAEGRPKSLAWPGDLHRAGNDTLVRILSPNPNHAARTADDQAIVAALEVQGFRVLLMSDAGAATEDRLVQERPDELRSDILVLGRHGEDVFATQKFLETVRPRLIVLAPADPFREGTSEPALRERLANTGAKIFDQAGCGAVTLTFDNERVQARGFLNGQSTDISSRED